MGYDGNNGESTINTQTEDKLSTIGISITSDLNDLHNIFRPAAINIAAQTYIDKTKAAVRLPPHKTAINVIIFMLGCLYRMFKFCSNLVKYLNEQFRRKQSKLGTTTRDFDDLNEMIGGVGSSGVRWPKALFALSIIPNVFTLILVICLIILLVWVIIQTFIRWITFGRVKLPDIPIAVDRKITQIAYSIFFVILSCYLMFYLLLDYLLNIKHELDIIQILKQFIASAYILWPIAALIIGSAIAKAFYKMACKGAKTNILNFAKIVESTALFIFGIALAIKIVLLIRPLTKMLKSGPNIKSITIMLDYVSTRLSIIMKAIVIYILLRMVTLFIEDVISNNIVFFVSKLSKNIESPPVNCNAEEKKLKKESEIGAVMIKVYRYIAMFLILIFIVFIVIIQCPHPWMGSFINLNNNIGLMIKRMLNVLTKYIGENDYGKNNVKKDQKGLGSLLNTPGKGEGLGLGVGEEKNDTVKKLGPRTRLVNEFDKIAETNALTLTNNKRNEAIRYGDINEQVIQSKDRVNNTETAPAPIAPESAPTPIAPETAPIATRKATRKAPILAPAPAPATKTAPAPATKTATATAPAPA